MCEFCSGNHLEAGAKHDQTDTANSARLTLSEQAGLGQPFASNPAKGEVLAGVSDGSIKALAGPTAGETDIRAVRGNSSVSERTAGAIGVPQADGKFFELPSWLRWGKTENQQDAVLKKYGLKSRPVGNEQEFYYTADKADHVVLREPQQAGADKISADLDKAAKAQISAIETSYKVKFAAPGEEIEKQWTQDQTTCAMGRGEMLHSIQPTFPAMFGIEQGLKHSSPSQFAADGKTGTKIYLLDKQYMPNIYGNKQVLGVYKAEDKNKQPALYMTPAGMALPPTAKDADGVPEKRNIAWVTAHEITHNSQNNNWAKFPPAEVVDKLGWDTIQLNDKEGNTVFQWYQLKGKNGELFMHGADDCHSPSTWYLADKDGNRLDANGNKVEKIKDAAHFTNDEVIARARVKPITYYFMNPTEMMSEGLTSYRSGTDSRAKLASVSPELYKAAQKYDEEEIDKFYGKDVSGRPTHVRMPDGTVVERDSRAEEAISAFEKPLLGSDQTKH